MKRIIVIAAAGAAVALGTLPAMAATGHSNAKVTNNCTFNGVTYTWNGPAATSVKKIIAAHPAWQAYADAHPAQLAAVQAFVQGGCTV
jgi:hypothetical protein